MFTTSLYAMIESPTGFCIPAETVCMNMRTFHEIRHRYFVKYRVDPSVIMCYKHWNDLRQNLSSDQWYDMSADPGWQGITRGVPFKLFNTEVTMVPIQYTLFYPAPTDYYNTIADEAWAEMVKEHKERPERNLALEL